MSRTVLVQDPAQVQPVEMALFMGADPPYDPRLAAEESAQLRAALAGAGMTVVGVRDTLLAAPRKTVQTLAESSVRVTDADRRRAVNASLAAWSQSDLVDVVIRQPGLSLRMDPQLAAISPDAAYESYVLRPLFGLMFPRDHYVDLGGSVVLGRLHRLDRARETAVLETVLTHLRGRPPEAVVVGEDFLEGGDAAVTGSVAVLNVGFRTSPGVLETLWPWLGGGERAVVTVRDSVRRREEFHLDHWLALGPGVALVAEDRLDHPGVVARCHWPSGSGAPVAGPPTTVRRALEEAGVTPLALDRAAVARFAANTLFLPGGRTALTSTAARADVAALLDARDFDVVSVRFGEHHKQFGSIHCAVNTLPAPQPTDPPEQLS